jgi:hypothetical protein
MFFFLDFRPMHQYSNTDVSLAIGQVYNINMTKPIQMKISITRDTRPLPKKAKNLGKILLSTKKSWPIKEKLGVFARSIGQDFSKKSGIKSRRFFWKVLGPKKKIPFFGDRKRELWENLGKSP